MHNCLQLFALWSSVFCCWNNAVMKLRVSKCRGSGRNDEKLPEMNADRAKRRGLVVNEWDIVGNISQLKQAILPSQVHIDKPVNTVARIHRSRLLKDLTLLLPSWLGHHPESHTISWTGSKHLVCPCAASPQTLALWAGRPLGAVPCRPIVSLCARFIFCIWALVLSASVAWNEKWVKVLPTITFSSGNDRISLLVFLLLTLSQLMHRFTV